MVPDGEVNPDGDAAFDPFADLFFTLIAAVLPAILVLLPTLHLGATGPSDAQRSDAPSPIAVTVGGRGVSPIIAGRDGLRLTGDGDRLVVLDAVPDDSDLRRFLERLRDDGEPLLVVVEPGGLEASFLLDPVAALHGPATMQQVRVAQTCADTRNTDLIRTCTAAGPPGRTGTR